MDIVEEIINDEKDEKRVYYFRKFLPYIIFLTIITATSITIYGYYSNAQNEHKQETGDMFIDVISGKITEQDLAIESLQNIIEKSDLRISELAQLRLAHDNIHAGNINGAQNILLKIIEDNSVLEITKSYAHIVFISTILSQKEISDSDKLQVSNLLHYFNKKGKTFFANAQLMKALFHFRIGQMEITEKTANEIIEDSEVPIVIKDQAYALKTMIKYSK